jgi:hypothetical protein
LLELGARGVHIGDACCPFTRAIQIDAGDLAFGARLEICCAREHGQDRRLRTGFGVVASFAGIDWIESLTPKFHSSIYGLLFLTFQLLAGLAFAIAIALRPGHPRPTFSYGPIFLSTLLLWAYIQAMQYIVIWAGAIPDEVVWYLRRSAGPDLAGRAKVSWSVRIHPRASPRRMPDSKVVGTIDQAACQRGRVRPCGTPVL